MGFLSTDGFDSSFIVITTPRGPHWAFRFAKAIEDCGTDFERGYLTIDGARRDALTEHLQAVHFSFDEAGAMIVPDRTQSS